VLINLNLGQDMSFGGTTAPCAYLELKSINLPEAEAPKLSRSLCSILQQELRVAPQRVYIEFKNLTGRLFGWNNDTF